MKLKPSELAKHGYCLYLHYEFNELIDLIGSELRRKTNHMRSFWLLIATTGVFAIVAIVYAVYTSGWDTLTSVPVGIAAMVAIIPVHELLHALAFRIRGARKIRFGAKPRQLIFYAIARDFVADYREMRFILYLPAAVITIALAGLSLIASAYLVAVIAVVIFVHLSACAGDFALASFMSRHRHLGIVTGDDERELVTRFYVRTPVNTVAPSLNLRGKT